MTANARAANPPHRPFDFGGNHLVLDFTNTVNARPLFSRDDLAGPADLVEWATAAGIVNHADPVDDQTHGPSQFAVAVALRENLYGVFGPIAKGGDPDSKALAFVVKHAAHAMRAAHWVGGESGYEARWSTGSVEAICDRLADEAMQLMRSPLIDRVGSCAGCGWLFLDVSRAHARRWCSMNACGVRDKMRRYHQRQTRSITSGSITSDTDPSPVPA